MQERLEHASDAIGKWKEDVKKPVTFSLGIIFGIMWNRSTQYLLIKFIHI